MHGPQGDEKAAQMRRLKERMERIKYKILVLSGKGGVGKSTVTANLALSLAQRGFKVGILDTDLHGPNIPHMLGAQDVRLSGAEDNMEPVELRKNLWCASLALIGHAPDTPYVWRGPLKIAIINQLIADVNWGDLDYLIIDSPPGTGDEPLTVAQTLTGSKGTVIVTTPQSVSVLDARRTLHFSKQLKTPVLGVIENMAGYLTPEGNILPLFGEGGGEQAAKEFGVPFLGRLPMDPLAVKSSEAGKGFMEDSSRVELQNAFTKVVVNILKEFPPVLQGFSPLKGF